MISDAARAPLAPPSAADPAALPFVSIIIPCRNEVRHVDACLESLLATSYPRDRYEVLVVDGLSDDGTRERLARFVADGRVQLLDNPRRITPAALNVGLAVARGSVILRADAHSRYPANYVPVLVGWLLRSGADGVGGTWHTRPGAATPVARAIARAMSHPFGVGNALFRLGITSPRWVDTVPFGCYRRDVFTRIGTFDEELQRNQDDELNLRLLRRGGRLLLVPDACIDYVARERLGKLVRMYWQYGLFKPLVARKVGRVMTVRQLVPAVFVLVLLAGALAAPWSATAALLTLGVLLLYASVLLACAARAAREDGRAALALLLVFPALHGSYGAGYLCGLVELLRRRVPGARTPIALTR